MWHHFDVTPHTMSKFLIKLAISYHIDSDCKELCAIHEITYVIHKQISNLKAF